MAMVVVLIPAQRLEFCNFCVRRDETRVWRVESDHPSRNWVLVICDHCMTEMEVEVDRIRDEM